MRSALLTSCCATALCSVAVQAAATAQAAPVSTVAPVSIAAPVDTAAPLSAAAAFSPTAPGHSRTVSVRVLLADATPAPEFSSSSDDTAADAALPDSPAPAAADFSGMGQAGVPHAPVLNQPTANKYTAVILPGQGAVPLSAGNKVTFALRQEVSPFTMLSRVLSATWSQALDSQPHYGQGWAPYGQRVGAAFARGAVQDLATVAVFDPIFHDDPRYYVLGRQHKLLNRAVYAATRVLITRTDSGHNTLNAPLLLGYAAAAGANMAYYPQRDRNFGDAATGYAGSLGGGVLGMEVNEFIGDALRLVHLRHD